MSELTHVVCPACNAVNRVPADRLADRPTCGKCKQPLFSGAPIELTDASFDAHVGRSGVPVVVDFWAAWCGPCRSMAPHFARAASQLEPHVRFAKVDTDASPQVSARYAIRSIPTLVVFRDGREIGRQAGAMDSGSLVRWLQPFLAEAA